MKFVFLLILFPMLISAQTNPIELGNVHWLRSFDEAQMKSKKEGKPILILFQEIPGCQTCKSYGSDVLTHPLLVEAIETNFIPLAIHNNKSGQDAEVLKRYNEPAWNNPVVRIVDSNGADLVSRLSGNYSAAGLTAMITTLLIKQKGKAPMYLQLLTDELAAQQKGTAKATYSMYCFWTGEALFGKLNGVMKTTAGYQGGKEVVTVEYDPVLMSKAALDKIAQNQKCSVSTDGNVRPDSTPKYYLSNSKYNVIPMTELQKCRVNSAIAEGQDPRAFLSERQIGFISASTKNCVGLSLKDAWPKM